MGAQRRFWQRALQDEGGATLVEYGCIIGFIALVAIAAVAEVGHQAAAHWDKSSGKITSAFLGKSGDTQ